MKNITIPVLLLTGALFFTACSRTTSEQTRTTAMESVTQETTTITTQSQIETKEGLLTVVYFNTGKSDAMLIHIGDFSMFIDTGDADDVEQYAAVMEELQIDHLDYIVLTHLDADHISGAAYLIGHYQVGQVIQPAYTDTTSAYDAYIEALSEKNMEPVLLTDTLQFTQDACDFTLLPPEKTSYDNVNNYSIVTSLVYGKQSYLFCGDANEERIQELLATDLQEYTVYKVPHHGFFNSEQEELMEKVQPQIAVITNKSLDNISGDVINSLEKTGAAIYYTYLGNVVIQSDGEQIDAFYEQ